MLPYSFMRLPMAGILPHDALTGPFTCSSPCRISCARDPEGWALEPTPLPIPERTWTMRIPTAHIRSIISLQRAIIGAEDGYARQTQGVSRNSNGLDRDRAGAKDLVTDVSVVV